MAVIGKHSWVAGELMVVVERRGSIVRQAGYLNPIQAIAVFLTGCSRIHPSFSRLHQDS